MGLASCHGAVKSLVKSIPSGELDARRNVVCRLPIVIIFIGLGGAYRLWVDFNFIIWGVSHKEMGPLLLGWSWPLKTSCKEFNLEIEREVGWE